MVVGILTPCLIALYLMIMMVAYHMFCKKQHPEANAVHNIQPTQYLEVHSGPENLKSPSKKLLKSNKKIREIAFLEVLNFSQFKN